MAYTALPVGQNPNRFVFWAEGDTVSPDNMQDVMAKIVMQRFRDARQAKQNNHIFQNKSTVRLLREADLAMRKEYTQEMQQAIMEAFGFCPQRYYGLTYAKVVGIRDWKTDLLAGNLAGIVSVQPTPVPRLDRASIRKIKAALKAELVDRLAQQGIGDPGFLLSVEDGRIHPQVKSYLDERMAALRQVEQARIVSAASGAASLVQDQIRDLVVEGDLRTAYESFNLHQLTQGVAFLKWPHMVRRVVLADDQDRKGPPKRVWREVPTFRTVNAWNAFPVNDGNTLADCTGFTEYTEVTKTALVGMAKNPLYKRNVIEMLLTEYSMQSRAWLSPESSDSKSENGNATHYWGPEELVPVLIHQGRVSGYDLQEMGYNGYDATDVLDVHVEICLGHTIRLEVKNPLTSQGRDYTSVKFDSLGDGVWNAVGVPAILQNTQDQVNILMHLFEANADWSMRPPTMTNSEAFKNPGEARSIVPGGVYEVNELLGVTGTPPDPIRAMRGAGAQYQIMWPLVLQKMRLADEEIGIPQLALTGDQFGKGSLGEYSARVSNALRRIKAAAHSEDRAFSPMWRHIFEHVITEKPELTENADLDMQFVGISGLLVKDVERQMKQARMNLALQGAQTGLVPQSVVEYTLQDALKSMGVPTEALGMSDPMIEQAIAIATANPISQPTQQVPALDGRSAAAQAPGVTSTPTGASTALPSVL